ncbi:MAG: hypothetical protein AVDCRST_MAG88-1552 [uncultured Thermomicrobiales bacterium]|uniref:Isochorismatase-like domain-containing protein n=1 Tax=uncultured Thermomicrobiales bacterium TaxID=1645740 RepID=A0A6J4V0R4_9BACT|nr:MAG: hypothetical protein AVDCRST_MAG88-1552 [uncultured Thermomicrobiales bacterium]
MLAGLTTAICVGSTARDACHHEFPTGTLAARVWGALGQVCAALEVPLPTTIVG